MRKIAAAMVLLAALTPAFAAQQLTEAAPLLSQPILDFSASRWLPDSPNPDAFRVGMIKMPDAAEGEAAVIIGKPGALRDAMGGVAQSVAAEEWRGKRVRLTARLKTLDATEVQIEMHVISGPSPEQESVRTMVSQPVFGTHDWQMQQIVMDVPADARDIVFGFYLRGPQGAVLGDSFKLEAVGRNVALTRRPLGGGFAAPGMVRTYSAEGFQSLPGGGN
jgi:hypothetical protein